MTFSEGLAGWTPKAIIFDLMGTCLDWHSSVTPALMIAMQKITQGQEESDGLKADVSNLALEWRQGFFDEIHARFEAAQSPEDIDTTHRRALKRLLSMPKWEKYGAMTDEAVNSCVDAWHEQQGTILLYRLCSPI